MQGESDILRDLLGGGPARASATLTGPAVPPRGAAKGATADPLRSRMRPWLALAATAAFAAMCLMAAGPLTAWLSVGAKGATAGTAALAELSTFLPLLSTALLGAWLSRSPGIRLGASVVTWLGVGAVTGGGVFAVGCLLAYIAGTVVTGQPVAAGAGLLIAGLAITFVQTLAEEMLLRGWLQPVLAQHWSRPIAVLTTAALFAALHLIAGARDSIALINLFLGGVLFGLLALRSNGLVAPVAAHFVYNVVEQSLFGLSPNPGVGVFGTVFDLDLRGQSLWGGSEEGLNASVALCIGLVWAIVPHALWRKR